MAKREKKQRTPQMTRKYLSRMEREQQQTRRILIGVGIAIVASVLVLLVGLYKTNVADPEATRRAKAELKTIPAVTVNGTMISIAEWQARVRFERMLNLDQINRISQQLSVLDPTNEFGAQLIQQGRAQIEQIKNMLDLGTSIASDVLAQMVEEQLIRQEAARKGIVITPDELQKHIEVSLFSYPYPPTSEPIPTLPPPTLPPTATVTPEPTIAPTPAPTARSLEDFEASYGQYTKSIESLTEMTEAMWRSMVEGALYSEKLLEAFQVETNVPQIKGDYIVAPDRETAEALLAQLEAGQTFEALLAEIEADESEEQTARTGSFDWTHQALISQRFGTEFAAAAFNTEAGRYVGMPIMSADGSFYLVYVQGNETRELASYLLDQQRQELFQGWLDQAKLDSDIVYGNWEIYVPMEP